MTQNRSAQRMKLGIVLSTEEGGLQGRTPTFRDLQEMAQVAEQVGLDSIWLSDHLIYRFPGQKELAPWEAFTMLSALAAVTTRIALGPLVACTSFRSPTLLAKMADTLDEISGGRFILGLGAGWHQPEYEAFGFPFDHLCSGRARPKSDRTDSWNTGEASPIRRRCRSGESDHRISRRNRQPTSGLC
jgi:alkanesulfonate monooxygenase SsuD/methylene tetrahydromethanopterin reductase-like flavin-dependent oxidoreductase (luciferase family)